MKPVYPPTTLLWGVKQIPNVIVCCLTQQGLVPTIYHTSPAGKGLHHRYIPLYIQWSCFKFSLLFECGLAATFDLCWSPIASMFNYVLQQYPFQGQTIKIHKHKSKRGQSLQVFFIVGFYMYCYWKSNNQERRVWIPLTSLTKPYFSLCPNSQARTLISNITCHDLFFDLLGVEVRCHSWWNCWPLLFILFFQRNWIAKCAS